MSRSPRSRKRWLCLRCGAVIVVAGDGAACFGTLDAPHARLDMALQGDERVAAPPIGKVCIDVADVADPVSGRRRAPVTRQEAAAAIGELQQLLADEANGMQVGDLYEVNHRLRGTFRAIVLDDQESHVVIEIAAGSYAQGINGKRALGEGEQFSVLKSACSFVFVAAGLREVANAT